jgi:hypothetical protein
MSSKNRGANQTPEWKRVKLVGESFSPFSEEFLEVAMLSVLHDDQEGLPRRLRVVYQSAQILAKIFKQSILLW